MRREPLCRLCLEMGRISAAVELDHIVPLFGGGSDDASNLQPLCDACHRAKTARENGSVKVGCDVDGIPSDESHHWYTAA